MHIPGANTIPMTAGAAVGPNRVVKIGAADFAVIVTTAVTEKPLGVTPPSVSYATGDRCDVIVEGVVEVVAGGTVTRGALVTPMAAGAVQDAAAGAGVNGGALGIALNSGVSGDLVSVRLCVHQYQG